MAKMPETLTARFTFHLTRRRSWSFTLPVAQLSVGRPESRLVDGQAVATVPITITEAPWFRASALGLRALGFILHVLRVRVTVEHHR